MLITIAGVMSAIVCVANLLIRIPIPATDGYFNIGDAMVFTGALIFGPTVGGFGGGVGSALADMISGSGGYAPITLVVKGIEGALAGLISNGKDRKRDVLAVVVGGAGMIGVYFLAEAFVIGYGVLLALAKVSFNFIQVLAGGIVSVPLSLIARRYLILLTTVEER